MYVKLRVEVSFKCIQAQRNNVFMLYRRLWGEFVIGFSKK